MNTASGCDEREQKSHPGKWEDKIILRGMEVELEKMRELSNNTTGCIAIKRRETL